MMDGEVDRLFESGSTCTNSFHYLLRDRSSQSAAMEALSLGATRGMTECLGVWVGMVWWVGEVDGCQWIVEDRPSLLY